MSDVFINLLNLSIAASFLIVAVILVRFLLKGRAPSWVCCLLWGLVAVRLILPFTVESSFSLVPNQKLVISDTAISDEYEPMTSVSDTSIGVVPDNSIPYGQSYVEPDKETEVSSDENVSENLNTDDDKDVSRLPVLVGDTDVNNTPPEDGNGVGGDAAGTTDVSGNTEGAKGVSERTASVLGWIWLAGFILMTSYATVSCVLLKIRVSTAIPCGGGVRKGERVDSPFVLGVFSPHIYLPMGLSEETENCVIAHERAHIKRFDHLIKPFGFFLLALYWFNPLVWVAYVLLCRDIENACDEKVIKNLVPEDRKLYAKALLECSVSHKRIVACPVAFGETGVKERVKNTMSYKKPAFWIIICAVIICVAVAVFFMTTSSNGSDESSVPDSSNTESETDSSNTESETESSDNESLNESEVSETESSDVSDEESIDENDSSNDEIYDESAAGKVYHGLFEAVEATDEKVAKLENPLSFKSKKEYNVKPVIITPIKGVTDFRICEIDCLDIDTEDGLEYTILETLYSVDKIEAGRPIVAELEMGEIIPVNAIVFTDSNGKNHIFSFAESPVDAGDLIFGSIDLAGDNENSNSGFVPDYSAGQANIIGNTRGNSQVAEQADWLYYADGKGITKINKSSYATTKVYSVSAGNIFNLNVVGDWLYFWVRTSTVSNSYIAKVRTDGSEFTTLLVAGEVWEMLVIKETVYYTPVKNPYTDYTKDVAPLYTMTVNGTSVKQISDGCVSNLCADLSYVYYSITDNEYSAPEKIYRMKHNGGSKTTLWLGEAYGFGHFTVYNSRIYILQLELHAAYYTISSVSINGGDYKLHGHAETYAETLLVCGNKIYFVQEEVGIIECNMSTGNYKLLREDEVAMGSAGGLIICYGSRSILIYNPSTGAWRDVRIS